MKDVPSVHIEGFTIVSLNCDQVTEGRHVDVLTADKTTTLGLKLKFASSDLSKMPSSVQGRFTRDEDGVAVNINFTYNSTTGLWTGTGTFLNSGKYTMQYLTLNGEHTGLEESLWITADIKLGMKAAVYTTDITNFKFAPDEMIENGTDQLQMQVKIMDNGDKVLSGLEKVKLTYRLKNEYNVDIRMNNLPYQYIRWIENEDINVKALNLTSDTRRIQDLHERKLLLFTNSWNITWATEHNPDLQLSEFGKNE